MYALMGINVPCFSTGGELGHALGEIGEEMLFLDCMVHGQVYVARVYRVNACNE